jgi:hypothetical protein
VAKEFASALPPRQMVEGFAIRTRKNLEHIIEAQREGRDAYVVTQLVNSLLGLVVFAWERELVDDLEPRQLDSLAEDEWPVWDVVPIRDKEWDGTLGRLVYHLRNAAAHGRISYSSDSRNIEEVMIQVVDCDPKHGAPTWEARIGAKGLLEFCLKFSKLIVDAMQ